MIKRKVMFMKRLLLVILVLMITATVANAASVNGEYNGDSIVRVTSQGKELTVEDVPAVLYDGRTMVPIYLLRQLGVTVTWDQKTYTADVKLGESTNQNKQYAALAKKYKRLIDDIEFMKKYSYTLEFFFKTNLQRSTSEAEDNILYDELTAVHNRYALSVKENQSVIDAIAPLSINPVYEIQNILYAVAESYNKAYEHLLTWKYALDREQTESSSLDKQAARNVAERNLIEFDKHIAQANDSLDKALELANARFNFNINEIK